MRYAIINRKGQFFVGWGRGWAEEEGVVWGAINRAAALSAEVRSGWAHLHKGSVEVLESGEGVLVPHPHYRVVGMSECGRWEVQEFWDSARECWCDRVLGDQIFPDTPEQIAGMQQVDQEQPSIYG